MGIREILRRHEGLFVEVTPEEITFEDAHDLSRHLGQEIKRELPVIHMEPASERRRGER